MRTLAGGYADPGVAGLGDGGLALEANLFSPVSVAVDALGNVFIADQGNNRVRKVTTNGIITTFAGSGVLGSSGDGGPATSAQLRGPQALTVDSTGRVYIGDCYGTGDSTPPNNRVRVVDSTGTIRTLVSGFACVFALAVDNANNVFVSGAYMSGPGMIFRVSPNGAVTHIAGIGGSGFSGDGGQATNAQFNGNAGIAIDSRSGTLYVADESNHRVRAISASGIIRTVAGTGVQGFSGDSGPGTSAQLNYPSGLAVDAFGNLYIGDSGNDRIRMLTPSGIISTIGGNGWLDQGSIPFSPPSGGLYPGKGDGGPATLGSISPEGTIAIDSAGDIYFAEATLANSVRELIRSASTDGCLYSVLPSQVSFPSTGGRSNVNVIAAKTGCPWLAFATTDWITITSGNRGSGNGIVSFTASPNASAAARSRIVAVAGQVISISQPGVACSFQIGPLQISAPAAGLTGMVNVSANVSDCPWVATSNAPWIFVTSGASGKGTGTLTYSVAVNSGGARAGTMMVAAQTITINQVAAPGFLPQISMTASAATGAPLFAAGQLISMYGTQLGPSAGSSAQIGPDGAVTKSSGGTQVLFDGVAAPILFAGANQVNAAIPCSLAGRASTQMIVQYLGGQSAPVTVPLSTAAPGIFTLDGSGKGQGAILNQDYSLNGSANPAPRGSVVVFYATGIGPTSPCIDGQTYQSGFPTATLPVIVGVGSIRAQVLYAGQAPYLVSGAAQINVVIPNEAPTGVVPLTLQVGSASSPLSVTIAVM